MSSSCYPITRHYQRYEYIINQGYITDKAILDVGCGIGAGSILMSYFAKHTVAIDPFLESKATVTLPTYTFPGRQSRNLDFHPVGWEMVDGSKTHMDVAVAMELIEHLKDPDKFLERMALVSEYLFLSTPLASKTGATVNPEHVTEYSHEDLLAMVEKHFTVLDAKYQTADLRIVDEASSNGCSIDLGHVVQMLWCKRK